MYQLAAGSTHHLADVDAFLDMLNGLDEHPLREVRTLFNAEDDLVVTRAPGRLDVMGGIADYSGSLVLQWPLKEATRVALQCVPARVLRIVSLGGDASTRSTCFEMPLAELEDEGRPIAYTAAQAYFQRDPAQQWAAYVAGAFLVLMREKGITFLEGAHLLIHSDVPEGKGVSSSAALEVAVMQAVVAAFDLEIEPAVLALLCQKVENLVVGAPCGVMDQMTAACGQAHRLMALRCQPADLQGMVALPDELAVWGLDSGVRHAVSGADYGSVRIGAFMGYRMIAEQAGLSVTPGMSENPVQIDDPLWNGYLANLTPSLFEHRYARYLPETITGAVFLDTYGGITDAVTYIDPEHNYAVRTPTAHPIYEHFRVQTFSALLALPLTDLRLSLLGELMHQSHVSYSVCGLGSEGTDRLVALVNEAGSQRGLYGAKITGGGSGGTVAVLGRADAQEAVEAIVAQYARETGHEGVLFAGSSPGADAFGVLRLQGG